MEIKDYDMILDSLQGTGDDSKDRMAAIIRSRYKVMTTVHLDTGMCESIYMNTPDKADKVCREDYDSYIQKIIDVIHEEDSYEFQTILSIQQLRKKAKEVEDYEEIICRYRIKEPSLAWIESQLLFVRRDEKTVVVNILDRDITREKLKEVADIKEKLESNRIIHSLSRLFFTTRYIDLEADKSCSVARIDKGGNVMGTMINYNESLGIYSQNSIHPDDRMEYIEKMNCQSLLNNLSPEHPFIAMEYRRIKKRDGDVVEENGWIRATVILVNMEGGVPKKALYVEQDVTESKEEQEREHRMLKEAYDAANYANKAKSQFLSRVSHDIRTPLNAIIGMAGIAGSHLGEKEKVSDCLNKINVSGSHLLSMINEVLDMSAIESGKIDLVEEDFTISGLVQNVLTMIQPAVQEKGHTLEYHPAAVEHEEVAGDAMRLQQVFMNILVNAVKYTPPGGKLELEVFEKTPAADGLGCYEFVFRDNGMGMSEEYQKQIFEPFSRAQDTRINKIEGTGLGMTIALNIIRMMNGDISVKSKVNEGSCFTVSVFLKQRNQKPADKGNERISETGQEPGNDTDGKNIHGEAFIGKRILLVDDIEINREIAMEIIGDTGAAVESAENGKEALEKFLENGEGYYDLIFMDVQMPLMNGYEATKAIRKADRPDAARIPIIAMTANAFTEDVMDSRKAGMNEHIPKPLNVEQVIGCMKRWLE